MATDKEFAALQAEVKELTRRLGLQKAVVPPKGRKQDSREGPLTEEEQKAIPLNYIHLKSPNGFLIHKMPSAYREQKEHYKGHTLVNRDGSPIVKAEKAPKKEDK